MFRWLVPVFILLLGVACTTSPRIEDTPPVFVIRSSNVVIVSANTLSRFPRSFCETAGSAGRDINQFNRALESSFRTTLDNRLQSKGVTAQTIILSTGDFWSLSHEQFRNKLARSLDFFRAQSPEKPDPDIAIAIEPVAVSMNIPGSFAGKFEVSVFEVSSGTRLWHGDFTESRYASGTAHQEVGSRLAERVFGRLAELGFV